MARAQVTELMILIRLIVLLANGHSTSFFSTFLSSFDGHARKGMGPRQTLCKIPMDVYTHFSSSNLIELLTSSDDEEPFQWQNQACGHSWRRTGGQYLGHVAGAEREKSGDLASTSARTAVGWRITCAGHHPDAASSRGGGGGAQFQHF